MPKRSGVPVVPAFVIAATLIAGKAGAVPPGSVMQWKTPMGLVIFNGKIHADRGVKCEECHPGIFQKKKDSSKITMSDIKMGNFCGKCHNGKRAFSASDGKNCTRCHRR